MGGGLDANMDNSVNHVAYILSSQIVIKIMGLGMIMHRFLRTGKHRINGIHLSFLIAPRPEAARHRPQWVPGVGGQVPVAGPPRPLQGHQGPTPASASGNPNAAMVESRAWLCSGRWRQGNYWPFYLSFVLSTIISYAYFNVWIFKFWFCFYCFGLTLFSLCECTVKCTLNLTIWSLP